MPKGSLSRYGKQVYKEIIKGNFNILKTLKYFPRWKASMQPGKSSIVDEQPWITFPVISLLEEYITPNSKVFEYGGGGSTLFFVNRAKEVVTVEHDKKWYNILEQIIKTRHEDKWSGNLILPEPKIDDAELDPSNPHHYFSNDEAFLNFTFKSYANYIDKFSDGYFDVVLVDGRVRPSCAWHSIPKIKAGGWLVIDNSHRSYYFKQIDKVLSDNFTLLYNESALSPYVDFFTQTGVWQKL